MWLVVAVVIVVLLIVWYFMDEISAQVAKFSNETPETFAPQTAAVAAFSNTLQRRFGMGRAGESYASPNVGAGTFWSNYQVPSRA